MKASAFLNTEESNITLSEYEIVAKSARNNQKRATIALGVPKISSELKNESYQIVVEKYSFRQNLQLANQAHLDNTNIDFLIGADTYWEFANAKFISDIKFENNRYTVSLPFKENRPILLDNYQISLNRLKKLKKQLDKHHIC